MAFYHGSPAIFSRKCMYKTKKNKIGQEEKKINPSSEMDRKYDTYWDPVTSNKEPLAFIDFNLECVYSGKE